MNKTILIKKKDNPLKITQIGGKFLCEVFNKLLNNDGIYNLVLDDIEESVLMHVNESLSINSKLYILSKEFSTNIINFIKNDAGGGYEKTNIDGIGEKKYSFDFTPDGNKIKFSVTLLNFKTKETYEKYKDNVNLSSFYIPYSNKRFIIYVNTFAISGTINEKHLINSIHHEMNHVFQHMKGMKENTKDRNLYFSVMRNFNSQEEDVKKVARALYYSFSDEQDAFINGLYAELNSTEENDDWLLLAKGSDLYNELTNMRTAMSLLENSENANSIAKHFNISKSKCHDIIRCGVNRLENKIGKIITRLRDMDDINENVNIIRNAFLYL